MSDSQYSTIMMLFGLVLYKVSETDFEVGLWIIFAAFFLIASIFSTIGEARK